MIRVRHVVLALLFAAEAIALYRVTFPALRERDWPHAAEGALNDFALADRALQRDLLTARAGLLRNYDPINADIASMHDASVTILRAAAHHPALSPLTGRLVADADTREAMSEQFKSDNALLQNSLDRVAIAATSDTSTKPVSALSARILRLTLDTSSEAVDEALRELRRFEGMPRTSTSLEAHQLADHARLLAILLPRVDRLIAQFQVLPVERDLSRMKASIDTIRNDAATRRHRDKLLLLVMSLLLAGALILSAIHIYVGFVSLKRRGEEETLHAAILSLLIDVRPGELPDRLNGVLKRLADYVLADRAYLILGDDPATAHLWSRVERFGAARAQATIQAVTNTREWTDDYILIETADDMPPVLRSGGTTHGAAPRSLFLVRSPASEGLAVLGFEADHAPLRYRPGTVTGLSTVMAAILQTIHRDDLENERITFERQLARSRRMETIGALASGIAHNFNNIIGAIAGFAETAELHIAAHSPVASGLSEIRSAAARAQALVDQILDFGRRPEGRGERIVVGTLIAEAATLLRASLPRDVRLERMGDAYPFLVEGNAAQLQQVLLNLVNNAALAMPDGGSIHCHAERQILDDSRRLSHATISRGDYIVITVRDSGTGIAPDALPKLFEPFFTTRKRGTGLGLSTAWEIVQDHGGSIDVATRLGDGSRFAIWLPAADAARTVPAELPQRGSGETILLLHQDRGRLEQDEELLAMLGYEPIGVVAGTPPTHLAGRYDAAILVRLDRSEHRTAIAIDAGIPLLIAAPRPRATDGDASLHYPLRPQELATALARSLSKMALRRSTVAT